MARDNAPKERQRQQLERKQNRRASYDRILIVCEGSKTEPNYFSEIRASYRLHTANVEVRASELGTSPLQVVQYARQLFEHGDAHRRLSKRAFEQVYAVFDRDDHASYFEALTLAEALDGRLRNDNKQAVRFKAIASVPSFELWLLLHFEIIHAPIHRDDVMRRLRGYIDGYAKGAAGVFAITRGSLTEGTARAEALSRRFTARSAPQPFTAAFELVAVLMGLRSPRATNAAHRAMGSCSPK